MSRIKETFERLKGRGRKALIPFLIAGDPDIELTEKLIIRMFESGADMIELGIPFSDPIADGKTIQAASQRALERKIHIDTIFDLSKKLMGKTPPIILMGYYNPILQYGLRRFAEGCRRNGIDGVIISDLPPEEAGLWKEEARRFGVGTIFLISPTTPIARIRYISKFTCGFLYYVSTTGVTGVRDRLPENIEQRVNMIKEEIKKPIIVGFGISTPDHVREVSNFADGVIIGSAIVKIIEENINSSNLVNRVGEFIFSLNRALER